MMNDPAVSLGKRFQKNAYERIDFPVLWMYRQEINYLKCTFLMFSFVFSTYLNTPFQKKQNTTAWFNIKNPLT